MAEAGLTVVRNELEAETLCGYLQTNGVRCYARRTDVSSALTTYIAASMTGSFEIVVDDRDLAAARELLAAAEQRP